MTALAEKVMLTTKELAERWSCSTQLVRKLVRLGRLRLTRIGIRSIRFRLLDVERYEQARTMKR